MASKLDSGSGDTGEEDPRTVSFRGDALKVNTIEDAQPIVNRIEACVDLETLEFAGNTFGVEAAESIAQVLEEKKSLKNCLWSDMFTGRLRNEIPLILSCLCNAVIKANTHLVVLDLSDNAFGPDGMKSVQHLLTSPAAYSIEELYFNNNGLGPGGEILANALIECHNKANEAGTKFALKTFVCGRNRIEDDRAKPLAEAFKLLKTLEVIRMPQNGIYHEGLAALAESFEMNPNLRVLDLSDNTFTPKGAKSISQVLPTLLKLREVIFNDCLIRDEGAQLIAQNFTPDHVELETVNLAHNEIQLDGGIALTDAIASLPAIKQFNLNGNELGDEGINDIKVRMTTARKYDVLDSFSEDEFVNDDGDDSYDPENNDSQEIDDGRESTHLTTLDNANSKESEIIISTDLPTSAQVDDFIASPSPEKLSVVGTNCIPLVLDYISTRRDPEEITDTVVRLAAIYSTCESAELRTLLIKILDAILSECAKDNPYFSSQFTNYMLVHFGMIKPEDKKFKPLEKLGTHLLVLSELIEKSYFTKSDRDTLLIFLQKPIPKLMQSTQELSTLITKLFM